MKRSLGISIFLKRSLVFPILFFSSISLHWSLKKAFLYLFLLFFGTLHSDAYIFPFLIDFSTLFFSQLFVRPPQTAILLFCIPFPWGWSWSLSPVQCHKPHSIVHQALYLSDRMWSTGEGNGKLLQYSCLENPMNSMNDTKKISIGILRKFCVHEIWYFYQG